MSLPNADSKAKSRINISRGGFSRARGGFSQGRGGHTPYVRRFFVTTPEKTRKESGRGGRGGRGGIVANNTTKRSEITSRQIVERVGNGVVVDLGHDYSRLYAVFDNKLKEDMELECGGTMVTSFLEGLMQEQNRKMDVKHLKFYKETHSFIVSLIKDVQCEIPDNLEEKMKVYCVVFFFL